MGLKKWLHNLTSEKTPPVETKPESAPPVKKPRAKRVTKPAAKTTKPRKAKVEANTVEAQSASELLRAGEKAAATAKGEPWVAVIDMQIDLDNPSSGAFNLDWNEYFLAKLLRAGYIGKTDHDVVDQWFSSICRNILAENFEQSIADPDNRERK